MINSASHSPFSLDRDPSAPPFPSCGPTSSSSQPNFQRLSTDLKRFSKDVVRDARRGFDSRHPPSRRPDLVALRILPTETRDRFDSSVRPRRPIRVPNSPFLRSAPGGIPSESGTNISSGPPPGGIPSESGTNIQSCTNSLIHSISNSIF